MSATMGGLPLTPIASPNERYDEGEGRPRDHSKLPQVDMEKAASLKPSRLRGKLLTAMVTFVAGTGFILFGESAQVTLLMAGYDQGVMSGLLTLPSFIKQFPETDGGFEGSHSATLQSFLVAICESAWWTS